MSSLHLQKCFFSNSYFTIPHTWFPSFGTCKKHVEYVPCFMDGVGNGAIIHVGMLIYLLSSSCNFKLLVQVTKHRSSVGSWLWVSCEKLSCDLWLWQRIDCTNATRFCLGVLECGLFRHNMRNSSLMMTEKFCERETAMTSLVYSI